MYAWANMFLLETTLLYFMLSCESSWEWKNILASSHLDFRDFEHVVDLFLFVSGSFKQKFWSGFSLKVSLGIHYGSLYIVLGLSGVSMPWLIRRFVGRCPCLYLVYVHLAIWCQSPAALISAIMLAHCLFVYLSASRFSFLGSALCQWSATKNLSFWIVAALRIGPRFRGTWFLNGSISPLRRISLLWRVWLWLTFVPRR